MKVRLITRAAGGDGWSDEQRDEPPVEDDFDQIPKVGEHIAWRGQWFEVLNVVHLPRSEGSAYSAEIRAEQVSMLAVLQDLEPATPQRA